MVRSGLDRPGSRRVIVAESNAAGQVLGRCGIVAAGCAHNLKRPAAG
jgi:hypothetical protein